MLKVIFITTSLLILPLITSTKRVEENVTPSAKTTLALDHDDGDGMSDVDVMSVMVECNETFRIEMSYLEALNASGSFPDETDKTPKCYIRCFLEKTGIASEEGEFDPALAAAVFAGIRGGRQMNDIQDIATGCSDRQESCKCERSYNFVKCIMETEIQKYENSQRK